MDPGKQRGPVVTRATTNTITSSQTTPRRYSDKRCAACGASFATTSGRARFCDDCRDPQWIKQRNTESKQRQRAEDTIEDLTRPPQNLAVLGSHRRADRIGWVRDALTMARRLHRARRVGLGQEVVKWARRTALGE